MSLAQPYVVNEKVEKVFSEGFTDINKNFTITSSSDPKFWGVYGDGYYYMKRKIASPRAIIVNADETGKNFYIKSKVNLALTGTMESSVGLIFLAQKGGKGGFVFELNKRKKFRIKELGTGAFITKEGVNGWLKSKIIASPERDNTIELKGFRGKFDIYINGNYLYSFLNNSYEKGNFGAYIGPNAEAKIYYYNVYKLDIPGVAPEVSLDNLNQQIETLKNENDSLKTMVLTAKYNNDDKSAISAIKILEKQLETVNEENTEIKSIIKKYEINSSVSSDSINQFQSIEFIKRLKMIRLERDSILNDLSVIKTLNHKSNFILDSLENQNMENQTRISFMKEELSQLKLEIAEFKLTKGSDSSVFIVKSPSKPSEISTYHEISSDSNATKYLETSLSTKNDSSDNELRKLSSSLENLKIKKDSLSINVVKNLNAETIDSVQELQKTVHSKSLLDSMPQKFKVEDSLDTNRIDSLLDPKGKSPKSTTLIKDSVIFSLIDSTKKTSIDSSLSKLEEEQPSSLPLDTIKRKIKIDLPIDTVGSIELIKKDSIYLHTLDIDEELEVNQNNILPFPIDSSNSVKIKVNKVELKD
jgi:hypothetical protein